MKVDSGHTNMHCLPGKNFHSLRIPYQLFSACRNSIQRRYKYKPKWAMQLKASNSCQRALDHFDAFYKPVYGDQWPSIRLSLLSMQKHCAVVNKYSDVSKVTDKLERIGAYNIIESVRRQNPVIYSHSSETTHIDRVVKKNVDETFSQRNQPESKHSRDFEESFSEDIDKKRNPSKLSFVLDGDDIEPYNEELYKDNINAFVPPEIVVSEKEKFLQEEIQVSVFDYRDSTELENVEMEPIVLQDDLGVFAFPHGDISKFPQPKIFNNKVSGYYLMDATSVLPVMALNLRPSDRVLDLCAAPGGKSVVMLQALDVENGGVLHCNDSSKSRVTRLKNVMKLYLPAYIVKNVRVTHRDGLSFEEPLFNKVLVDVPCNTDRHVVNEEDNNLFKQSRSHERHQMMRTQRDLLISGIKSCLPGGSIVYSTCTLAAAQNDGVIQAAVDALRETSQIEVVVEDLSPFAQEFQGVFKFFSRCRYGQLVLPHLAQNFGPTYFAKLKRIK